MGEKINRLLTIIAAALLILSPPAFAQDDPISSFPSADLPLDPADLLYVVQDGVSKKVAYSDLVATTGVVQIPVIAPTTAITTGDGKWYMTIPAAYNGLSLVGVSAHVITVSSSGAVNVDLARCAVVATGNTCSGTVVDMLSTNLTIDANESKSSTAAAAAVIDTANDDVSTDQVIRIDVDGAGTGAQGLIVTLVFE